MTVNTMDDILRKVQGLIARADHPNTPPAEADACRNKAEMLMLKYRIDEMTVGTAQHTKAGPVWRHVYVHPAANEFGSKYRTLLSYILDHFDARGVFQYVNVVTDDPDGPKGPWYVAHCVGYEADLRFVEAMFTAASLAFSARLEPKYDPTLSEQVNAYLMRSAGMEGRRIAMAIYGRDDKNLRPKVRQMFKREAEARGEDPRPLMGQGVNVKGYREDYADGFCHTLWSRLNRMRQATAEDRTALVLSGRKDAVQEAFYDEYPQYRPVKREAIGDGYEDCAKCKKAKSGYCRDHAYRRPRADTGRSTNWAAYDRGSDAARTVDLGHKETRVTGTSGRKEIQ